jgi:hypothetical protein
MNEALTVSLHVCWLWVRNASISFVMALLNKSIFQPEDGRSGMICGEFTCERADAVQTQREPPSQDRESALQSGQLARI